MVEKNRKLHNQFDSEASSSSHNGLNTGKNIFRGVSIFVDGYTVPSSQVCLISDVHLYLAVESIARNIKVG